MSEAGEDFDAGEAMAELSGAPPSVCRERKTAPPRFLQLELVGQCNLRCRMCPSQHRREGPPWGPPAFMEWRLFTELLEQSPQLAELHLDGIGEPSLHPRFFDIIAAAARRGVRVSASSNCTRFDARGAQSLVASGLHELFASVDGATRETYEAIRAPVRFTRVLRNLALIRGAKKSLGSVRPLLTLTVVAMRENLQELPALVRLARRLGIPKVFVQNLCHDFAEGGLPEPYWPMRDYAKSQALHGEDRDRVRRYFSRAREAAAECGVELRLPKMGEMPQGEAPPGPGRCGQPWNGAYVSYRGLAMPCSVVGMPERACLGDFSSGSFKRVWNGDAYGQFRAALASQEPPDICRSCAIYWGTF